MATFETRSHVGPDGKLLLNLPPALADTDVDVRVEPARSTDRPGAARRPMTQEEWRAFVDRFAGSMPDFPDIERPGPNAYEDRGEW